MRAIAIDQFGGRERLELKDVPLPRVGPDYVLIRVRAAGMNPVDWKMREGGLEDRFPHVFPVVPGWDAAGVVERVGPAVRGIGVGDEVYAYCRKHFVGEGTYAEYVSVPDAFVAPKPETLDLTHAAAVPLAGLTAYQALVDALRLRDGETILIHAGAGGVGSFAVQIARALGAQVIATASTAKHDYLRELGALHPLDYRRSDVASAVRTAFPEGIDAVLDIVGGHALERSVDLLRPGGRLVSIVDKLQEPRYEEADIEAHYIFVRPDGSQLWELGRMIDDGRLRVHLEHTFPLEQAAKAHARLESGRVQGKLVLEVG